MDNQEQENGGDTSFNVEVTPMSKDDPLEPNAFFFTLIAQPPFNYPVKQSKDEVIDHKGNRHPDQINVMTNSRDNRMKLIQFMGQAFGGSGLRGEVAFATCSANVGHLLEFLNGVTWQKYYRDEIDQPFFEETLNRCFMAAYERRLSGLPILQTPLKSKEFEDAERIYKRLQGENLIPIDAESLGIWLMPAIQQVIEEDPRLRIDSTPAVPPQP